jgi:hypothetical protein
MDEGSYPRNFRSMHQSKFFRVNLRNGLAMPQGSPLLVHYWYWAASEPCKPTSPPRQLNHRPLQDPPPPMPQGLGPWAAQRWGWMGMGLAQCLKVRRAQKIWAKAIPSVFEKIGEIQENSAKMQWRGRRNSQFFKTWIYVGFTELSTEFTDKSPTFTDKSVWWFPVEFWQKPVKFFSKSVIGKKKVWKIMTWYLLNLYIQIVLNTCK